jgi:SAM-dependent methyltransferase
VAEVSAEQLPFDDQSFDAVVGTLVLCTIPNPELALAESARVLRPNGRFLFLEHVRGEEGTRLARWQDRLERPWGWFAGGCHPNRDTAKLLEGALAELDLERTELPKAAGPVVRPAIRGSASPS